MRAFNAVIFGKSGVGKSAVINLIAGKEVAKTSSDAYGCTLESKQYTFQIASRVFNVWDTIGLGEPTFGDSSCLGALEKTYSLIQRVMAEDGLDLLLFCIRRTDSRISQAMLCNYRLFFEVFCEKRIPIALVVTFLDGEARMDDWWDRNVQCLSQRGITFSGHACVTGLLEHEKEMEARVALERLLMDHDRASSGFLTRFLTISQLKIEKSRESQLKRLLSNRCMVDNDTARQLAKNLARLSAQDYRSESHTGMRSSFNIIIFGEAGAGKSSVINLIADKDVANTSRDSWGCTLESKQYRLDVAERTFNIWDTIGLGEPAFSASNCLGAIGETYTLIKKLEAQGGLDLLLFCMPGSRVTATMQSNYRLFFEVLCEEQIPIAAVVTRLEDEERMEEWWCRNEEHLRKGGLKFGGHACITGKRDHTKAAEGRSALELLLLGYDNKGRYPMPRASDWFSGFLERLPSIPRSKELKDKQKELERLLIKRCKMDPADAQRLAKILTRPDAQG